MTLFDQINSDITAAMKAREKVKLEALRNIKKVMLEAKSAKGASAEISDDDVLKIISKLAKQGNDSAAIYKQQNREDLYEVENLIKSAQKIVAHFIIPVIQGLLDCRLVAGKASCQIHQDVNLIVLP